MKCKVCAEDNEPGASRCKNCGSLLPTGGPVKGAINVGDRYLSVTIFHVGDIDVRAWHSLLLAVVVVAASVFLLAALMGGDERCQLFVQADPLVAGSVNPAPLPGGDGKYDRGQRVTLTAVKDALSKSHCSHWIGTDQGKINPAIVVCDQDRRVIAVFAA